MAGRTMPFSWITSGMVIVDAARKIDEKTLHIIERIAKNKSKLGPTEFILVMNKVLGTEQQQIRRS